MDSEIIRLYIYAGQTMLQSVNNYR